MDEQKMKELLVRAHSSQEAPPFDALWRQAKRSSPSPSQGRKLPARAWWLGTGLVGAAAVAAVALFVSPPAPAPAPGAPADSGGAIAAKSPADARDPGAPLSANMEALVASLESLEVYEDYVWSETEQDGLGEDVASVVAAVDDPAIDFDGLFEEGPTDFLLEIDFGQGEDNERNLL